MLLFCENVETLKKNIAIKNYTRGKPGIIRNSKSATGKVMEIHKILKGYGKVMGISIVYCI